MMMMVVEKDRFKSDAALEERERRTVDRARRVRQIEFRK
jgi:hypothetical protein